MKNKTSILILLIAITIPQIASASWWNPTSWFNKETIYNNPQPTTIEYPKIEPQKTEIPIEKTVEKTPEKVIEKVIKVDNPKLQIEINNLLKENADLKSQISSQSLTTQKLNSCKEDLVKAQSKIDNVSNKPTQTTTMAVTIDGGYCTSKEPSVVKFPISVTGGWWQYGEIVLSKNLANPNSWSSEDSVTAIPLWPGTKELKLGNRNGNHQITINFYNEKPINGQVNHESIISSFDKTISIPKGLPCQ